MPVSLLPAPALAVEGAVAGYKNIKVNHHHHNHHHHPHHPHHYLPHQHPPPHKQVLKDLYLEVNPGTVYALLGPSGCGKTTLLMCVLARSS